jgi:hypothetical protein
MNTIKNLAKNWWLNLDEQECHNFRIKYPDFNSEGIFYQEVILKWWDNIKDKFSMLTKYFPNSSSIFDSGLKEIYIKEHSKEEPLKGDVLEEELWNTPQSVDNTIDMEETDVWDEIYKHFPITWETPAVRQVVQYIQNHYTLIKK